MSVHTTKLPDPVTQPAPIVIKTTTGAGNAVPRAALASASTNDEVAFIGNDDSAPGFEPWLGVTLLTFVPGALIFFLPHALLSRTLIPICVAMAAFFFAGFGMLLRDRKGRRHDVMRSKSDPGD
jgi:hypothetical protein